MAVLYTDDEIEALVGERKPLPADWQDRARLKAKRGHEEQALDFSGDVRTRFRLILRKSRINRLDFSIILAVLVPQSTQVFRLRRYNGRSHEHTNRIENETFYDFHIHFRDRTLSGSGGARRCVRPADQSLWHLSGRARMSVDGRQLQRSAEGAGRALRPRGRLR